MGKLCRGVEGENGGRSVRDSLNALPSRSAVASVFAGCDGIATHTIEGSRERRKQREGRSTSQLIGKTPLERAGVEHPFDALHSGESRRAERVAVGMVWAGTKVARGW